MTPLAIPQVLTLEVWDRDIAVGDDFIGTSYLPLQDLEPMKQTFIKLPVSVNSRCTAWKDATQPFTTLSTSSLFKDDEANTQYTTAAQIVNEEEQQRISSYAGATTASGSGDVEPSRLYINVT